MSGLEPPTSLDWLPTYSNQLNYTAPFIVFYVATLVATCIVYPTIPAAPGCPWSPHFLVPTQYTLALWYRHFLLFAMAGCVSSFQRAWKVAESDRRLIPGRFLKHQPYGWGLVSLQIAPRFCFFLPYSGAGGLEPPLIQGLRRLPLNVGTLQRLLIPIWLHHLPAFCPMSRAPHGGRNKTNV